MADGRDGNKAEEAPFGPSEEETGSETPEDDEFVIESGFSDDILLDPNPEDVRVMLQNVTLCQAVLPNFEVEAQSSCAFRIRFPSIVLPRFLAVVNRFDRHAFFLDLSVMLTNGSFRTPAVFEATHSLFGVEFPGRPLVLKALRNFFREYYAPKQRFRSHKYLLWEDGTPSPRCCSGRASTGRRRRARRS
jgi:hypothetical protein